MHESAWKGWIPFTEPDPGLQLHAINFNPNPGTCGLFGPDTCISVHLVWLTHPVIPISYVFVTNSAHFEVIMKTIFNVVLGKKIMITETQKLHRGVTRACLTRAPLPWSEVPATMATESLRWETTIPKWQWKYSQSCFPTVACVLCNRSRIRVHATSYITG